MNAFCVLFKLALSDLIFFLIFFFQGQPPLTVEMRYLSLSIIFPPSPSQPTTPSTPSTPNLSTKTAFILAAASNGLVDLFALPLDPGLRVPSMCHSWTQVATLQYNTSPVLSVQGLVLKGNVCGNNTGGNATGAATARDGPVDHVQHLQEESANMAAADFESVKAQDVSGMHRYAAFSAGTDGSLAIWDISSCIEDYLRNAIAGTARGTSAAQNKGTASGVSSWRSVALQPLAVISGVHQSGVNGMSAAQVPCTYSTTPAMSALQEDELNLNSASPPSGIAAAQAMVATVGDDQALCASLFNFQWIISTQEESGNNQDASGTLLCTLRCQTKESNAHSSAARDVWTDGGNAYSVGLDHKVRQWELNVQNKAAQEGPNLPPSGKQNSSSIDSGCGGCGGAALEDDVGSIISEKDCVLEIRETGCVVTQVLEPAAIDVAVLADENKRGAAVVAVAGRGLQVLSWQ